MRERLFMLVVAFADDGFKREVRASAALNVTVTLAVAQLDPLTTAAA